MTNVAIFLLAGLGIGAVYATLSLGLVVTYKGTGVINFAAGSMGAWSAFVFSELRTNGRLTFPVVGVPGSVHITDHAGVPLALACAALSGALLGLVVHLLVFRPLRSAPDLAKVVASAGVMLAMQALIVERFGSRPRVVDPIITTAVLKIHRIGIPAQVFWLAGIVIVVATAATLWFHTTRSGLALRASAENELTTSLARYSPDRLAALAWVAASTSIGFLVALASPVTGLNSTSYTLYIVPALACALVGRLTYIAPAVAAAFGLGMIK
ncbi:MAG TPA: branched-chain amino acid ABC transporter permease, partial [Ilumatobacteraceae bacterium]